MDKHQCENWHCCPFVTNISVYWAFAKNINFYLRNCTWQAMDAHGLFTADLYLHNENEHDGVINLLNI
jgi:hypothetical protein